MREIKYIVCHTTATDQDATVEGIKRFWRNNLGWKNPGYHFLIEADGKIHNLHPIEGIANGVRGHNSHSIHISYIGGKYKDDRTEAQKEAITAVVRTMKAMYPEAEILGHRDLSPDEDGDGIIQPDEWTKTCPRFDAGEEFAFLNKA